MRARALRTLVVQSTLAMVVGAFAATLMLHASNRFGSTSMRVQTSPTPTHKTQRAPWLISYKGLVFRRRSTLVQVVVSTSTFPLTPAYPMTNFCYSVQD